MRASSGLLSLLLLALPLTASAQAVSAPGAAYKSDGEGWQVQPPKAWKHVFKDGKLVLASDTEAGVMFAWFQPGVTYAKLEQLAKEPYEEQGIVLTPGAAAPFKTKAGKALAVDYTGAAPDGTTIRGRAIGVAGTNGAVFAVALTTQEQFAAHSKRVDALARGISFFKPKVGAGVALINVAMCSWSGSTSMGGSYSSTRRMTFDGKGNVSWGAESTFSGSTTNDVGDTTSSWGGYGGNQHTPTDMGRSTDAGDTVNISWGDGSSMSCTVHHRNGAQIVELKCDGKLWGRGLCD